RWGRLNVGFPSAISLRYTSGMSEFKTRLKDLLERHEALVQQKNVPQKQGNGIYQRWQNPVLTADHAPVFWCYDLCEKSNPWLLERLGVNATFNAGALYKDGRYLLVVRVEGNDRKSFFAV